MKAIQTTIAVLLAVGMPAMATTFVWDGNGNPNNSGNWSDPLNWDVGVGYPDDPSDTADLQAVLTSPRVITVDVPVSIDVMIAEDHANHTLLLAADLTVHTINGNHDKYKSFIDLNGQTLTVSQTLGPGQYMPALNGPGLFVKTSDLKSVLQGNGTYFGSILVDDGTLAFRADVWNTTTLMTVSDGATAEILEPGPEFPPAIVINGQGHLAGGALSFKQSTDECTSDITLGSDSKIKRASAGTTILQGDIIGSDVLTLEGPGDFQIDSAGASFSGTLVVKDCNVLVLAALPNVSAITVDGGVLEALAADIPAAVVTTINGGVWVTPTSATWDGNGNANNSGNWSDPLNWAPNVVPTGTADLQTTLASDRYITVDAPTTVDTIIMEDHQRHHVVLAADLTVDTIDGLHDKYKSDFNLGGNTLTISRAIGPGLYVPALNGPGLFVKTSTGTAVLQGNGTYTGAIRVDDGLLRFRADIWNTTTLMTVNDGATAELLEPNPEFPPSIAINGQGFNGAGALRFSQSTDDCSSDIAVATDSTLTRSGTQTTILTGNISGPGDLTLDAASGSTFDLDGTYNLELDGNDPNSATLSGGTLDISDATLAITFTGIYTVPEHVVIDYSGGTLVGAFDTVTGLPVGGTIEYLGTATYPDAVVMVLPPVCDCDAVTTAVVDEICSIGQGLTSLQQIEDIIEAALDDAGCPEGDSCGDAIRALLGLP